MALFLAFALVACGDSGGEDTDDRAAHQSETPAGDGPEEAEDKKDTGGGAGAITVTATEYSFDLPPLIAAGPASFTLKNEGKQPHHLILAKLAENAPPIEELIELRKPEKFLEEDLTGDNPPHANPGETAPAPVEAELTSGTYAYVCFLPDAKTKQPHAFLGMYGTFQVQ